MTVDDMASDRGSRMEAPEEQGPFPGDIRVASKRCKETLDEHNNSASPLHRLSLDSNKHMK